MRLFELIEEAYARKPRPVDNILHAMKQSEKVYNSKVVKSLGGYYLVVDKSDPRPAITADVDIISKLADLRKQYKDVVNNINNIKEKFRIYIPGKPDLDRNSHREMVAKSNYEELIASREKLGKEIRNLEKISKSKTINAVDEAEVWDKPNPKKKHEKLSPKAKSAAKRRAKAAGRPYPNMVDNIWAARKY